MLAFRGSCAQQQICAPFNVGGDGLWEPNSTSILGVLVLAVVFLVVSEMPPGDSCFCWHDAVDTGYCSY